MLVPTGLRIDSPAWPLLQALGSYWGVTSGAGNALGTTLVDALCSTAGQQPSYVGLNVKLLSSNAAGQSRPIQVHALATGTITVASAFTDFNGAVYQVPAGTLFCITSAGGGGGAGPAPPPPEVSLWMFGHCDPTMVASTTAITCPNLAGRFSDDVFNNQFWMQVIRNANAAATAPEREIHRITDFVGATGTFTTDAFTANVEANDEVAIFHESIMSIEIAGYGTLDTSSVTVPADSTRAAAYAWENDDYFNGSLLMPTEGNCRLQARPILDYTSATGVFTLAQPFSQLPGAVDYVIIRFAYPSVMHTTIDLIFDLVNAMFTLQETGGELTTDGTEQDIIDIDTPLGVFEPAVVQIDMSLQTAADTVIVRTYYRIVSGGAKIKKDEVTFAGVQDPELKNVELEPNRFGFAVTLERVAGGAIAYPWAYFFRD